jgi:hypothetical protein
MIFILWAIITGCVGVICFYLGTGAGSVSKKKEIERLDDGLREINTFAMQQAAVGDSTASVVVDMVHNTLTRKN